MYCYRCIFIIARVLMWPWSFQRRFNVIYYIWVLDFLLSNKCMAQRVDRGWTYSYCLGLHFSFFIKESLIAELSFHFYWFVLFFFFFVQTTVSQSTLFDHLINIWEFSPGPVPGTCNLYFLVDFKFQSPLYSQVWFCYHLFHLFISTCFLVSLCFALGINCYSACAYTF